MLGGDSVGGELNRRTVERYDRERDEWTMVSPLPCAMVAVAAPRRRQCALQGHLTPGDVHVVVRGDQRAHLLQVSRGTAQLVHLLSLRAVAHHGVLGTHHH